jgi:hypothetical protein
MSWLGSAERLFSDSTAVTVDTTGTLRACLDEIRGLIAAGLGLLPLQIAVAEADGKDRYADWLNQWTRGSTKLREHVRLLFPDRLGEVVWWRPIGVLSTNDDIEQSLRACELVIIAVWDSKRDNRCTYPNASDRNWCARHPPW